MPIRFIKATCRISLQHQDQGFSPSKRPAERTVEGLLSDARMHRTDPKGKRVTHGGVSWHQVLGCGISYAAAVLLRLHMQAKGYQQVSMTSLAVLAGSLLLGGASQAEEKLAEGRTRIPVKSLNSFQRNDERAAFLVSALLYRRCHLILLSSGCLRSQSSG